MEVVVGKAEFILHGHDSAPEIVPRSMSSRRSGRQSATGNQVTDIADRARPASATEIRTGVKRRSPRLC